MRRLSKRIFPVDCPRLHLFTVFPVLYLKWYVGKLSAPAIFHCFNALVILYVCCVYANLCVCVRATNAGKYSLSTVYLMLHHDVSRFLCRAPHFVQNIISQLTVTIWLAALLAPSLLTLKKGRRFRLCRTTTFDAQP